MLILLLPQFPYRSEDFPNEQSPTTLPCTLQETYRKHAGNDLERMNKKILKKKTRRISYKLKLKLIKRSSHSICIECTLRARHSVSTVPWSHRVASAQPHLPLAVCPLNAWSLIAVEPQGCSEINHGLSSVPTFSVSRKGISDFHYVTCSIALLADELISNFKRKQKSQRGNASPACCHTYHICTCLW